MTIATQAMPSTNGQTANVPVPVRRPYVIGNPVDDFRWLLSEMGTRGLAGLFRRRGRAVFVPEVGEEGYIAPTEADAHNGPATVRTLAAKPRSENEVAIGTRLAIDYEVLKTGKVKGEPDAVTECFFPRVPAEHALDALEEAHNLRPLRGVTHTPMVRADGTVLDTPGYDQASGYLYLPAANVAVRPVATHPTPDQVGSAVALLRGMIGQFSWAGPHDEANFLGLLLTPLLRELCPPPYKLGAIMARQPGSGKSLLNRILRDVHGGVFRSEMPHDDKELEKALTSILVCTTAPVVQFDNVAGTLRSSRFAGLLTTATYSGRILGGTNNTDMTNDRLWTVTGNNLNFGGDLIRRTLWVTIDPGCPDPHLRTGFALNIPDYVARNRGDILHALLTLVTAWCAAGMPAETRSSDDYARWSSVVRGILIHAGIPGEFDHAESAQQRVGADDEDWDGFLSTIRSIWGDREFLARDITARMALHYGVDNEEPAALIATMPDVVRAAYDRAHENAATIMKSLGKAMRDRDGRFAGALTIRAVHLNSSKTQVWRVMDYTESQAWLKSRSRSD